MSKTDEQLLNKYNIPDNMNLQDYAMAPIKNGSLFIKNGVMYILGGVSSGKSTLMSKLIAVYNSEFNPIIISFYSGLSPDETSTFALNTFRVKPTFVRLITIEAMYSFFNQFRYKRVKLAELLMFLMSIYKNNSKQLLKDIKITEELNIHDKILHDNNSRLKALLSHILELIGKGTLNVNPDKGFIYLSEFILKQYSRKRLVNFNTDPALFVVYCLISISKGFHEKTITVDILNEPTMKFNKRAPTGTLLNRFQPYTFKPFLRVTNNNNTNSGRIELVPSICIFDDVAQFPLLTTERSNQWTKDLFAETRRWMNTFIIAAQRHNLLNKTLRSLTHTFFIGYSLVDDDIPKIAKEIPSNLLSKNEFIDLYQKAIKPFHFFVYNNKLGYNILNLSKDKDKQDKSKDKQDKLIQSTSKNK